MITRVVIFEAFPQHLWTSLHSPTLVTITNHFSRNHNTGFISITSWFHMVPSTWPELSVEQVVSSGCEGRRETTGQLLEGCRSTARAADSFYAIYRHTSANTNIHEHTSTKNIQQQELRPDRPHNSSTFIPSPYLHTPEITCATPLSQQI